MSGISDAPYDLAAQLHETLEFLRPHLKAKPEIALVLGSGLGGLVSTMEVSYQVDYEDIPGFQPAGVSFHAGKLVFGHLDGHEVVCMQGRVHLYEGYKPEQVVYPIYLMHALGANSIIITNAAGGIRQDLNPGTLMAISDHINFTGKTAFSYTADPRVIGEDRATQEPFNPFVDMTNCYSPRLRAIAAEAAQACGIDLKEGIYIGTHGPQFETPAEIRAFRAWGADAVGMSTVLEATAARSVGMEVLGLSLITNDAAGLADMVLSGQDVIETAREAAWNMSHLIEHILSQWT